MWAVKCIVRHPPGGDSTAIVDAVFLDAHGTRHTVFDKYLIFRTEVARSVADGAIRCEVLRAERLPDGGVGYLISTARPDGICAAGSLIEEFLVLGQQLEWTARGDPGALPSISSGD